eukprot:TRINITY_DN29660_c0_g1_i1.p1 TRINITY_DN29660_c0_g1~~TRINITY_DN29660_c0_g1_i1.p1  ORF type:complete len:287 (+),score=50.13 TRINITY_DN29660_c0_g1_i1:241-1101(+)
MTVPGISMPVAPDERPHLSVDRIRLLQYLEGAKACTDVPMPFISQQPEVLDALFRKVSSYVEKAERERIVTEDLRAKAKECEQQAARYQTRVESLGLAPSLFSHDGQAAVTSLATAADLLELSTPQTSSYLAAMAEFMRAEGAMQSCQRLEARRIRALEQRIQLAENKKDGLTRLMKRLKESEVGQLALMEKKASELNNMLLPRNNAHEAEMEVKPFVEITHGALVNMAREKQSLEVQAQGVLKELKAFHNLPPDVGRAEMLILQREEEFDELRSKFDAKLDASMQ